LYLEDFVKLETASWTGIRESELYFVGVDEQFRENKHLVAEVAIVQIALSA